MGSSRLARLAVAAAVAGFLGIAHSTATTAEPSKVGVAAAVNPSTEGQAPGAPAMRTLILGSNVMFRERIVTSAKGQAQLLFLDQSSLTVAPNSELVIDEFVYDPEKKTGKLAATVTKGIFRFVGGRISKQEDVTFKTPTATIGIRGGVVIGKVDPNGATSAFFVYGQHMNFTSGGQTQVIYRPGFFTFTNSSGSPPAPPSQGGNQIGGFLGSLEGHAGSNGGALQTPSDGSIPAVVSSNPPPSPPPPPPPPTSPSGTPPTQQGSGPGQGTGGTPTVTTLTMSNLSGRYKSTPGTGSSFGTTDYSSSLNRPFNGLSVQNGTTTVDLSGNSFSAPAPSAAGKSVNFTAGVDSTSSPFGPISGTGFVTDDSTFLYYQNTEANYSDEHSFLFAGIPTTRSAMISSGQGIDTFTVGQDFMLNSAMPFIRQAGGGSITGATASNLYMARQSSGLLGDYTGLGNQRTTALQASIAISGQGTSQTSAIAVMTGALALDPNFPTTGGEFPDGHPLFEGGVSASARLSATDQLTLSNSSVTSESDSYGNHFFGNSDAKYFVLDNAQTSVANQRVEEVTGTEQNQLQTVSNTYAFNQVVTKTTTPSTIGVHRTDQTLNGYVGGLVQTAELDESPNSLLTPVAVSNSTPTDPKTLPEQVSIRTSASNNRVSAQFSVKGIAADPDDFESPPVVVIKLGGIGDAGDLNQPSSGKHFLASRSAFIDDNTFAAREQMQTDGIHAATNTTTVNGTTVDGANLYMVTHDVVNDSGLLPSGVSYCSCQYVKWGYWGGNILWDGKGDADAGHLMTWVAGTLGDITNIQGLAGTATYNGHLIGNVLNGSAQYTAVGAFQNEWNFAARRGTITVTNFDGLSFATQTNKVMSGNGRDYSITNAAVSSGGKNYTATFNGSFFAAGTSPTASQTAETAGQFSITNSGGSTYKAAGTFAATKTSHTGNN
jgi:hypothetical protein